MLHLRRPLLLCIFGCCLCLLGCGSTDSRAIDPAGYLSADLLGMKEAQVTAYDPALSRYVDEDGAVSYEKSLSPDGAEMAKVSVCMDEGRATQIYYMYQFHDIDAYESKLLTLLAHCCHLGVDHITVGDAILPIDRLQPGFVAAHTDADGFFYMDSILVDTLFVSSFASINNDDCVEIISYFINE